MASSKPARLKVILAESNTEKLTLPNDIPDSLDELLSKVKDTFGLKTNIRLQYMDKDFGNDFFNLSSTSKLEDLGTVKVIQEKAIQTFVDVIETAPSSSTVHSDDSSSLASNDTVILSSPESLSSQTQQWPANFPIPIFSYQEVVNEEPGREDFKDRWPALFQQKEINAEFQRLMALPLEQTSLAQLDRHSSQLIEVIQAKGGATRAKMVGIMRSYDEVFSRHWDSKGMCSERAHHLCWRECKRPY
ncbi:uncharacterized protein LOC115788393 isoform X2 [Archocentrus centrarchus]|nr:uncharacterized protein LOC115788393 isoform X2 [Archocentrus centrarchus]